MTKHDYHAAEWVFPGHPDKLCDAIADALVEEAGGLQQRALCALEVAVTGGVAYVTGRLGCDGAEEIDVEALAQAAYRSAGYGGDWTPEPQQLGVVANLCRGPLEEDEERFRDLSDDQTISVGYACESPSTNWLPVEHCLAWRLGRRLHRLRDEQPELQLGPDGKVIVQVDFGERQVRLAGFSTSLQQKLDGDSIDLTIAVREAVEQELELASSVIAGLVPELPSDWEVNGCGNFAVGGPEADNGLSGKKLVVDAYGPRVPIGGGAWSGKDFYKPDRAGAIFSRRFAKAVVLAGAASECTVTLGFFPGDERARVFSIRDQDGQLLDAERWGGLFDLSLGGCGDRYTGKCDLVEVARMGHFTEETRPWERLGFDGEEKGERDEERGEVAETYVAGLTNPA
jgi:S-adenosylmethionine synthetase